MGNKKFTKLKGKITDLLQGIKGSEKIRKIGIVTACIVNVILSVICIKVIMTARNRDPGVLMNSLYNYMIDGKYSLYIDSKTDTACMLDDFQIPLDSSLEINGTINSNGQNKYIKATLNGNPSNSLGSDSYEDTTVQIYTDGKDAYYGIGDEFTWKKSSANTIIATEEGSMQECLVSLTKISKEDFEKAFTDKKVTQKNGKNILSGKINLTKFRNSSIKDQLYVLYGFNDINDLKADISVEFSGNTPVKGSIKLLAKNESSLDTMYEKMGLSKYDTETTGETTDAYGKMNVDEYVTDDDSLGSMSVVIETNTTFTFDSLSDDVTAPDMSSEKGLDDTSDISYEWYGLNNTINYFFNGGKE